MSAIPAPSSRGGLFVVGLILIDLPVLAAIVCAGFFFGFMDVYDAVMDWRMQHWWSLIPSVVVAVLLVRRWSK